MQCRNCGAQNGNVRNCTNCGAPLTADPSVLTQNVYPNSTYPGTGYPNSTYPGTGYPSSTYPGTGYPSSTYPGTGYSTYNSYGAPVQPQKKKTALIVSISAAAVALIVGLILLLVFTNPDNIAKRIAKKTCKAMYETGSYQDFLDLQHPNIVAFEREQIEESYYFGDWDEYVEDCSEEAREELENMDVSYEIVSVEKVRRGEIDDMQDQLDYADIDLTIQDARLVELDITYHYKDGDRESEEDEIYVVKIGSKWYLWNGV